MTDSARAVMLGIFFVPFIDIPFAHRERSDVRLSDRDIDERALAPRYPERAGYR